MISRSPRTPRSTRAPAALAATLLGAVTACGGSYPAPASPPPMLAFAPGWPEAVAKARREKKPVVAYVSATWCPLCQWFAGETFASPGIVELDRRAVWVWADVDNEPNAWGGDARGLPRFVVFDSATEEAVRSFSGWVSAGWAPCVLFDDASCAPAATGPHAPPGYRKDDRADDRTCALAARDLLRDERRAPKDLAPRVADGLVCAARSRRFDAGDELAAWMDRHIGNPRDASPIGDAMMHSARIEYADARGDESGARKHRRMLLAVLDRAQPRVPTTRTAIDALRATLLLALGEAPRALALSDAGKLTLPNDAYGLLVRAELLAASGRDADALVALDKGLRTARGFLRFRILAEKVACMTASPPVDLDARRAARAVLRQAVEQGRGLPLSLHDANVRALLEIQLAEWK